MRETARGQCRMSNLLSGIEAEEDLASSSPSACACLWPRDALEDRVGEEKETADRLLCRSVQTDERQKECEAQCVRLWEECGEEDPKWVTRSRGAASPRQRSKRSGGGGP